jgi:hypothetical protein
VKSVETIVGVDFAGPTKASDQRRKIIAVRAQTDGWRQYRILLDDFNRRLTLPAPGWTVRELAEELVLHPAKIVALDFPFSIPNALLRDVQFARAAGSRDGPFTSWRPFNWSVTRLLRHQGADIIYQSFWPKSDTLDFSPFSAWRKKDYWLPRDTDRFTQAHPPLKDRFQNLFQMTLAGNVLLDHLGTSKKYRIVPLWAPERYRGEAIEVYPGYVMRQLGLRNYKAQPAVALRLLFQHIQENEIKVAVESAIIERCLTYNSSGDSMHPDHDVADALVCLGTAILYREGCCAPAVEGSRWEANTCVEGVIWGLKNMPVPHGK